VRDLQPEHNNGAPSQAREEQDWTE
jgi:hypothetical protein